MILALDIGNSEIFGGVFDNGALTFRFRKTSRSATSSDELGLFLRNVLRENGQDPLGISLIAIMLSLRNGVGHAVNGAANQLDGHPTASP